MTTYTNRETAPLTFHTFNRYVFLPLGILSTLGQMMMEYEDLTSGGFYTIDLCYTVIALVLGIVSFYGFFGWMAYAWYAIMALRIINIVYAVFVLILWAIYLPTQVASLLGEVLGTVLVSVPICIYYAKRKPLFVPAANKTVEVPEMPPCGETPESGLQSDAQTVTVSYCYQCGSKLVPGSNFCNQCGTPVAKIE